MMHGYCDCSEFRMYYSIRVNTAAYFSHILFPQHYLEIFGNSGSQPITDLIVGSKVSDVSFQFFKSRAVD